MTSPICWILLFLTILYPGYNRPLSWSSPVYPDRFQGPFLNHRCRYPKLLPCLASIRLEMVTFQPPPDLTHPWPVHCDWKTLNNQSNYSWFQFVTTQSYSSIIFFFPRGYGSSFETMKLSLPLSFLCTQLMSLPSFTK